MLCAKYDYKMDIAVKQQEAAEEKAEEVAKRMLSDNLSAEKTSLYSGLPLEKVLELQKEIPVQA